jgi:hypothetical protein
MKSLLVFLLLLVGSLQSEADKPDHLKPLRGRLSKNVVWSATTQKLKRRILFLRAGTPSLKEGKAGEPSYPTNPPRV